MLKYGNILQISNGNSKTLIPRNLTYNSSVGTTQTIIGSGSTSQSTANFNSATITDLTINTLNIIPNTLATSIVVSSPIAFSFLKADYQINNFSIYPILFTEDILIKNKNFNLNTNNLIIKDNVFILNNALNGVTINGNQTDNIISGFIFPVADNNQSTDYYSGFLYVPNNKLAQISAASNFYNWTNNQYNYFKDLNKGFFKFKYLSQSLNFETYNNVMDRNYLDLVDNNKNLANLQANGLALYDGEIVGLNNNLYFNLSDGTTIYNLIDITPTKFNLLNNLGISFINNLFITDANNNKYISFDGTKSLINFYQNLSFDNIQQKINFINTLEFNSGTTTYMKIDAVNNQTELFGTVIIDSLQIVSLFELNNIPFQFINSLQIISNGNTFITFDSVINTITMVQTTYVNNLIVLNSFKIDNNNPIIFLESLNINDILGNRYLFLDGANLQLNLLLPTSSSKLSVNSEFSLSNNIPVIIDSQFTIKNNTSIFMIVDINNTKLHNNLVFVSSTPKISFPVGETLNISDISGSINLNIDNSVTINGPTNSYQDITKTIVGSSFNITNTKAVDFNLAFTPYAKSYILSGITQINALITYEFLDVININNMSGKLIGTTWGLNTLFINAYEINVWTYPVMIDENQIAQIGYSSLSPVNTNNNGDWYINNIYLTQPNLDGIYNLNVECKGSTNDRIVWGFKLDILQI